MILKWILDLEVKSLAGGRHFLQLQGRMEQKIHSHGQGTRAFSHYPLGQRCLYIGREVCVVKKMWLEGELAKKDKKSFQGTEHILGEQVV